jgi:hypothetical protein
LEQAPVGVVVVSQVGLLVVEVTNVSQADADATQVGA